jgi:hypothetical protein
MRQVGVLCAAAHVAVRDTVGKLADDHRRAKSLAGFMFFWNLTSLHFDIHYSQVFNYHHDFLQKEKIIPSTIFVSSALILLSTNKKQ